MIVVIAVTEKQVVITDAFNTAPITGRNGIFARVNAPTEIKAQVEIVGAYTNLDAANAARENHARHHPGRKYVQKVCHLDDSPVGEIIVPKCIKCGTDVVNGRSFCPPCGNKHLQECAEVGGEGDQLPLVKATHGQGTELVNR